MNALYKEIAPKAYDWRGVIKALECSRQEYRWWQADGRFPQPDGLVMSYTCTSMSRAYDHLDNGWLPETIETVKPYIENWRADYRASLKSNKKKKKAPVEAA